MTRTLRIANESSPTFSTSPSSFFSSRGKSFSTNFLNSPTANFSTANLALKNSYIKKLYKILINDFTFLVYLTPLRTQKLYQFILTNFVSTYTLSSENKYKTVESKKCNL